MILFGIMQVMPRTKRLFIAINLPKDIQQELAVISQEIKSSFPDETGERAFKWVRIDNLHITLVFLDNIKEDKLDELKKSLAKITSELKPFSLKLKRVCYGPNKKLLPSLIWAEGKRAPGLESAVEAIKARLVQDGFLKIIDKRPFKTHITLARVRKWQWRRIEPEDRPDIERKLDLNFQANSIDIMESKLRRSGSEYRIVSKLNL